MSVEQLSSESNSATLDPPETFEGTAEPTADGIPDDGSFPTIFEEQGLTAEELDVKTKVLERYLEINKRHINQFHRRQAISLQVSIIAIVLAIFGIYTQLILPFQHYEMNYFEVQAKTLSLIAIFIGLPSGIWTFYLYRTNAVRSRTLEVIVERGELAVFEANLVLKTRESSQ